MPVTVEVRVDRGIHFLMVGLPDSAVRESQQRIKSAIEHLGFRWPGKGITINLAPAGLRKEGAAYDLPLALGILAASEQIDPAPVERLLSMGELALDGTLRPVRGGLALAEAARNPDIGPVILPQESAGEAGLLDGVTVHGAEHLRDVLDHLSGTRPLAVVDRNLGDLIAAQAGAALEPLTAIRGQQRGVEAIALAAAGGHNLCMVGPPGAGKTMLAKAMVGLLPPLTPSEALAVNRIHSVTDRVGQPKALLLHRPFRSPHHTISDVALVGGGSDPRPGEISLAHAGVLFLDELPEMPRHVLEVLRQPLESREVTISRARATVVFPADFQLVAAMNPCPCGYAGHPRIPCRCAPGSVRRYRQRISGPLLDRVDIRVELQPAPPDLIVGAAGPCPSPQGRRVAGEVRAARARAAARLAGAPVLNAALGPDALDEVAPLRGKARTVLERAARRDQLSSRALQSTRRVARTAADLRGAAEVGPEDVATDLALRPPL